MSLFLDKIILVTGGAEGIGKSIASHFAEEGGKVYLADRNRELGEHTAHELSKSGLKVNFVSCDVSKPDEISAIFSQIEKSEGQLDVLVNNAGINKWISPYELTVENWDLVLNTNLRSVFLCSRTGAKLMQKAGQGAIINIASTRAFMSEPDSEAYAASKGGMLSLTHALAISLSKDKIRVNAISPGWIETGDYKELRTEDHSQHPAGRVGKPEDVARACLFLADARNDFITGQQFILDGGMTRKMIYLS